MKIVKIALFLFMLSFATHALSKSNEYYQAVVTNVITNCKTDQCKKEIFEQEFHLAFFNLMEVILSQIQQELRQKRKEKLWSNVL